MLDLIPCLTCDRRQRPPMNGRCACLADPQRRDILVMVTVGCPHPGGPRFTVEGGATEAGKANLSPAEPTDAVPREQWPLRIKALALMAKPEDKGVGDTAHRVLSHLGADALAKLYEEATGKSCGCADRQARLNAVYPYDR